MILIAQQKAQVKLWSNLQYWLCAQLLFPLLNSASHTRSLNVLILSIYIYMLADSFIQSDLHCIQGVHLISSCIPWGSNQ